MHHYGKPGGAFTFTIHAAVRIQQNMRQVRLRVLGLCYTKDMKLIYFLQYLAVAAFWWLYKLVPVRLAYPMGAGLGRGLFALFRRTKRARVAIDNVVLAGLGKTRHEAYLIARNSLGHFIGHLFEALRASEVITRDNWREYMTLEMTPETEKLLFNPTCPVLMATGHLGSWEAAITAIVSARPMMVVARLMDNPYVQKFLERHNFRGGITVLPKQHGFSRQVIRRWTSENAALAILFDQYCSRGVLAPFFGYEVPCHTSPVRLHLKTGAPILVGGFLRTGPLKYKMVAIGDPITEIPGGDTQEALRAMTAELMSRLEQVIRMAPEQYLWLHRRWRGIPVPEVPEK